MARANSPEEGMASLIRNLEANTGKSIDAWIATARATGQTKHGQIVAALKKDHGLSHGYANQIALRAIATSEPAAGTNVDPLDAHYAGAKAGLRPIHDALVAAIKKFGSDVEFSLEEIVCERAQVQAIRPDSAVDGDTRR